MNGRKEPWRIREGKTRGQEFTNITGEPYLRLMRPHLAEKSCLKCHGNTGYKVGDVVGGVEVALPLKPFLHHEYQRMASLAMSHGAIFLFGLVALFVGRRKLENREAERHAAEESLRESGGSAREREPESRAFRACFGYHLYPRLGRELHVNKRCGEETAWLFGSGVHDAQFQGHCRP